MRGIILWLLGVPLVVISVFISLTFSDPARPQQGRSAKPNERRENELGAAHRSMRTAQTAYVSSRSNRALQVIRFSSIITRTIIPSLPANRMPQAIHACLQVSA